MLIFLLLLGCRGPEPSRRAAFAVFGTEVEVIVRAGRGIDVDGLFARLGARLQVLHRELHPWEDGALMALNRALAEGRPHRTTATIADLLRRGRALERDSLGAYNPAIGDLVHLWGFHTSEYPIISPPPAPGEIEALLERRPSTDALNLQGVLVTPHSRAVRLDFSGLAKGWAAADLCAMIGAAGFSDALVNSGGDVMVCGATETSWRVAIRDPAGGVLETREIDRPMAVFTSGNYYRYAEFEGERYAHILDPATGFPVDAILQATVIDPDPVRADAAATALVVAGPARWRYEATVGAGLPVIQTLRDLVDSGDRVDCIEGIFSGTLAWLFNRFEPGMAFSDLVREAHAAGYTEPDPADDLSGLDVAR
ncbi:MAG: FAD:protein FMN transferase, partial [Wenzhouxiangellaceae bacterium]